MKSTISVVFRGTRARINRKKPVEQIKRWNIVRGDLVEVVSPGPDKGKQGTVLKVLRDRNRVLVDGVQLCTRHIKARPGQKGRSIVKPMPIHYSNVNLVDPQTGKPTRIAHRWLEDGTKVRVAKRSGAIIPKPEWTRKKDAPTESSAKCTSPEAVLEKTFNGDLVDGRELLGKLRFEV